MSKIVAIGTAVPSFRHRQEDVLSFMQRVYAPAETDRRKLRFLYGKAGIETRYSVVPDYSRPPAEWKFYPPGESLEPFPSLELRMSWYQRHAASLSMDAIRHCLDGRWKTRDITHLITVSCTGMSAPGLDLELLELLDLPRNCFRTSVNFMGCYAAVHALKIADALCASNANSRVLIVCTELCTLHFQREATADNIAASLLFADGSAAALVTSDQHPSPGLRLNHFYAEVLAHGKKDMAWELSSSGFLMTLSGYIPELIREDFKEMIGRALEHAHTGWSGIGHWCIHPGGRRILEAISESCEIEREKLASSYEILRQFGNMSSATLLFVLKNLWQQLPLSGASADAPILAAAFGPGLTMETLLLKPVPGPAE